jgi:tetratricopeptide (TPR) repeat protein
MESRRDDRRDRGRRLALQGGIAARHGLVPRRSRLDWRDPGANRRALCLLLRALCLLLALSFLAACATGRREALPRPESQLPAGAEAWSLFGEPLFAPSLDPDTLRDREKQLAEARARFDSAPDDPGEVIWLGRRTAYLGHYREAIAIFSSGIERFPTEPRLYRHRGHRLLTTRRFDLAIADLEAAARLIAGSPDEIEPDGLPNPRNIPTSTLNSNVWYHLGLAHYLTADFEKALAAYRECLRFSTSPDMLVATTHWFYMTLRRLGRDAEAAAAVEPILEGMDIIENRDYHRLLLMYQRKLTPDALIAEAGDPASSIAFATVGYGIGNWHLFNGRRREAVELFRRVIAAGSWTSFGYIAAEAELARIGVAPRNAAVNDRVVGQAQCVFAESSREHRSKVDGPDAVRDFALLDAMAPQER